jgi:hypothetical protein
LFQQNSTGLSLGGNSAVERKARVCARLAALSPSHMPRHDDCRSSIEVGARRCPQLGARRLSPPRFEILAFPFHWHVTSVSNCKPGTSLCHSRCALHVHLLGCDAFNLSGVEEIRYTHSCTRFKVECKLIVTNLLNECTHLACSRPIAICYGQHA